jgi:hypothetical protein
MRRGKIAVSKFFLVIVAISIALVPGTAAVITWFWFIGGRARSRPGSADCP